MPTFDFQCKKCQTIFEFTRPFGSEVKPGCPNCKSKSTQKLISLPVIQFKGTGFYKTDSTKKTHTPQKPAKKEEATKPAPEPKKESKTPEK